MINDDPSQRGGEKKKRSMSSTIAGLFVFWLFFFVIGYLLTQQLF